MIPNKSNTTNGCDSTSSNCVVWQGPDLTCVDVCNGDTVSDIIAKLCDIIKQTTVESPGVNISTINQLCLETTYGSANTIQELTQNIITLLHQILVLVIYLYHHAYSTQMNKVIILFHFLYMIVQQVQDMLLILQIHFVII